MFIFVLLYFILVKIMKFLFRGLGLLWKSPVAQSLTNANHPQE